MRLEGRYAGDLTRIHLSKSLYVHVRG